MFIDEYRDEFGVEPICRVLQFAPSTYWSAKRRAPSARSVRDEKLKVEIQRVFDENFRVYGAPKIWTQAVPGRDPGGPLHRGTSHA